MTHEQTLNQIRAHIEAIFASDGWQQSLQGFNNAALWLGPSLHAIHDLTQTEGGNK